MMNNAFLAYESQYALFLTFSLLFGASSLLNILAGFFEKEKLRRISKPFCLVFLGIAASIASPSHFLIYLGCFLGAIGDFFLLYKRNRKCLVVGLSSFLLGHFCYIAETIVALSTGGYLEWWSYLVMAAFYILSCLLVAAPIYGLTKHSKLFTISGTFYCATLLSLIASAALGLFFYGAEWYIFAVFGGISFFASDLILTSTIFRHDFPRRDFYIMLTYLLGEAGIVYGMIFTLL